MPKMDVLHFFDYSSVEPRLAAYFADRIGHPEFADQIRAGTDAYTAVAKLVTQKQEVTKDERQQWKRMFLSLLYGGGVYTIQQQFGIERGEAKSMIRVFHDNFPAVRTLQDTVIAVARKRGHIKTPWGRHLHIPDGAEHKLLNSLIQGSAADLMKEALIKVDEYLSRPPRGRYDDPLRSHMISVVHDEIQLDGPESEVEFLHEHIPRLMRNDEIHEVVPILVDHEVSSTSWAEKIPYEDWKEARATAVA